MSIQKRLWRDGLAIPMRATIATAIMGLAGCNGHGSTTATPVATPTDAPTPAPLVVVAQGSGSLPGRLLAILPFSPPAPGTLEVTVDWTFTSNNVEVYLARGACSFEQFIRAQCQVVSFSESATAKPERLTVPGSPAGLHTLLIGNRSLTDESVAYQIVLTPAPVAAASLPTAGGKAALTLGAFYERSATPFRQ